MIRFYDWTTPRLVAKVRSRFRFLPLILSVAVVLLPSLASAATLDWNAATGNWNVAGNWFDYSTNLPAASPPGTTDDAEVRNGGTVTLSDNQSAQGLFIGFARLVESDPIGNPGVFDLDVGLDGAMDWTGGTLGTNNFRIGKEHNGTVMQSGLTSSITMTSAGTFRLGDSGGTSPGTGTYTMTNGSITMVSGTTGNNGIDVINGTFNLKGGTITQTGSGQRIFKVASRSNSTSTVNISGGTINASGGMRLAEAGGATGILNINENDGTTIINLASDLSVGRNAAGLGQMVMDAGTLQVGVDPSPTARLIVGDTGPGTFTMNNGTVNIFDALRLAKSINSAGTVDNSSNILLKGGIINARAFESRSDASAGLETVTSTFTIDGGTFNQTGNAFQTTVIGQNGKVLLDIKSGAANVAALELGASADSQAAVSLSGTGTLTVNGTTTLGVNRTVASGLRTDGGAIVAPVVNLTGGTLKMNSTGATTVWQTDFTNNGSHLEFGANALLQVRVGDTSVAPGPRPGNFEMNSGSWDIDVGAAGINGADWINVLNGTAALNGGVLNINQILGYVPFVGDTKRIVRDLAGVSLGSVTLTGDPHWIIGIGAGGTEIQLTYVPEPSSCILVAVGLMMGIVGFRRRS